MAKRLQKVPIAKYVAAVEAIPSVPAYCVQEKVLKGYENSSPPSVPIPPAGTGVQIPPFSPSRPIYQTVTTCYPAKPGRAGVPAGVKYSDNNGWNGGGRSRKEFPDYGYFRGTVPTVFTALQIGICTAGFNYQYSTMSHAIVVRMSGITIVERGVVVLAEQSVPLGGVVEIQRRNGVVTFLYDGDEIYTSENLSVGETYIGATLYSTADFVDDPEIASFNSGSARITMPQHPHMMGSDDDSIAFGRIYMPKMQLNTLLVTQSSVMYARITMPATVALGSDRDVAFGRTEVGGTSINAIMGQPENLLDGASILMPPPRLNTLLVTGNALSFSATIPQKFFMLGADRDVAYGRATMPGSFTINAWEPYMPEGEIDGGDVAYMRDTMSINTAMLLVAMDSLEASSSASLVLVLEMSAMDEMRIADLRDFGSMVELIAMEGIAVNSRVSTARQQALQYAVNAASGALTTYEGFDFLGFVNAEDETYAWRADGLYRIGGRTDDGELTRVLVDFGTSDYRDAHDKHVSYAYLGVRSDGCCYLRARADGDAVERVYKVEQGGNMRRQVLAKGVSGRYWNMTLEITDASYVGVDSIEVEIGVSQRRRTHKRKN